MTRDRGLHTMLGVCAAILVLAALYLTRPIFAPVAFALFIIAIVWPFQRALQLRMPKLPALAVTLLVTVVVLTALGSMVVRGFGRAGQWLIGNAARFQTLYVEIAGWLEQHGVYVANLLVESFNVAWIVGMVREVSGRLQTLLSFAMVALVFTMLGLLEVDLARQKLESLENQENARALLRASSQIASKFQRYMLVRSLMSVLTGLVVWAVASLAGLELASAWGVIAFALNYIPFIGPLFATVFPTLFALRRHLPLPEPQPVPAGQLPGAARGRRGPLAFALHGPVCGVLLELPVGNSRSLHRCAHHDRAAYPVRAVAVRPMARGGAVGACRRGEMTCLQRPMPRKLGGGIFDGNEREACMRSDSVLVDLALQGGGAHGAFTWGVLDRLLEEPWLRIDGISGTSAGAMNAAVLADGHAAGGADGARGALEAFWRSVSRAAEFSPLRRTPLDVLLGRWTLDHSPAFIAMDLASRLLSPYDLSPSGFNPLREILAERIDFDRLARAPIKVFVTATSVRTGRGHVFRNSAITPEVLLASACLPTLFQAIEIDGEAYWDGGYSGNPTITPLVRECSSKDTILVQINPVERPGTPRSARDILNRLNEVSFNAVLLKELRMIALLRQVASPGDCEGALWAGMRIHRVASEALVELGYSSKLNAEWEFLCMLRDAGSRAAEAFLATHQEDLGQRSSLDLDLLVGGV